MMAEIAAQGQDITAEELLRDVLKFGEEKKKRHKLEPDLSLGPLKRPKSS
jgi:hypothetical protein